MGVYDHSIDALDRAALEPHRLEHLQQSYGSPGSTVLAVPCNQFSNREPGTSEEIRTFCATTYGGSFPMSEKVDVNGDGHHPLYRELAEVTDAGDSTGDTVWNFASFLLAPGAREIARVRPLVEPGAPAVLAAIEAALPS